VSCVLRIAPKALELARAHGGLYNKAAQFVAALQAGAGDRGVPREYVEALSVLTDKAPGLPFAHMAPVLEEEFGKPVGDIFKWIEETPIAAASLAQVHLPEPRNRNLNPNPEPCARNPKPEDQVPQKLGTKCRTPNPASAKPERG
jgi:hypothetical protein